MNLQENNISENNFEQCIKCTVCTVYCPVIPANPKYPGPKQAGPDGERFRLKAADYLKRSSIASTASGVRWHVRRVFALATSSSRRV